MYKNGLFSIIFSLDSGLGSKIHKKLFASPLYEGAIKKLSSLFTTPLKGEKYISTVQALSMNMLSVELIDFVVLLAVAVIE
jgi:hypothetical protein